MASKARAAFDSNAKDIERLLELHLKTGGSGAGRRYNLEVLNKSAIVLITAFWEAYCEDIAAEGLEHLVEHAPSADALPDELKKQIAKKICKDPHDLAAWKLSDDGWREYLRKHLADLKTERDRKMNTPKTAQIDALFKEAVGISKISSKWNWAKKMTVGRATEKLDRFVTLRGAIAHRGSDGKSVTKAQVTDYFEFIKKLVALTGGAVNNHVLKATKKPLWPRRRKRS